MTLLEIEKAIAEEKAKTRPHEAVIACLEALQRAEKQRNLDHAARGQYTPCTTPAAQAYGYTEDGVTPPWWNEL